MFKIKNLAVALALMLGVTVGALVIATPAQASLTCGNGRICLFEGDLAQYGRYDYTASAFTGCHYVGSAKNDKNRSAKIGGSVPGVITLYANANCTGVVTTLSAAVGNNYHSCYGSDSGFPYWNTWLSPCVNTVQFGGHLSVPEVSAFYYSG